VKPSGKVAIAIRHVAFEDLGNLEASLRAQGFRIHYKDAGVDPLRAIDPAVDLLVVLGGPIGVYEESTYPFIGEELRLLEKRLARDLPTLGICLGAQMMARALGASVRPGGDKEIGWAPLTLAPQAQDSPLDHLRGVPVLHWHGDTFDVPAGAVHRASTERYLNQAFSWGRHGLALQFHAEVREAALERWYIGHACEIAATPAVSVAQLRAETRRYDAVLQTQAAALWQGWLSTFG
jgi:GMP synthase (glutamine-hydrolysing)